MTETAGLYSLFASSFLAATLLPGGSEAILFAMLRKYPDTLWMSLGLATLGNTLGGMTSFFMGWLVPQRELKHVEKVRRYGTPVLLLAWAPLIGDAFCLAAVWLRMSIWQSAFFMTIGKFARYALIAITVHHL